MSDDQQPPFPETRRQRQFKAWHMPISDKTDPPREGNDKWSYSFLAVAAVICLAWGGWIALSLRAWLKTL